MLKSFYPGYTMCQVKEGVQQLVTLQNPHVAPQAVVASSEKIIEVHKYMLEAATP